MPVCWCVAVLFAARSWTSLTGSSYTGRTLSKTSKPAVVELKIGGTAKTRDLSKSYNMVSTGLKKNQS
jgi:hypothetical protein